MLTLLGITALSVMPSVPLPRFDLLAPDKLAHAASYAALTWTILHGFSKLENGLTRPRAVTALVFSIAWGCLMEGVQYALVPGRMCEFDDMIANSIGAVVAFVAARR